MCLKCIGLRNINILPESNVMTSLSEDFIEKIIPIVL